MKVLLIMFVLSLLWYLNGLFLTRRELSIRANLHDQQKVTKEFSAVLNSSLGQGLNYRQSAFKHLVVLLIDGLRLDFMTYNNRTDNNSNMNMEEVGYDKCGPTPYNCWKNMHALLRNFPKQTSFMGFKADAPTTTSQRMKGITTGTLPTFIDIGSNLNSDQVTDDNIIDQLRDHFLFHPRINSNSSECQVRSRRRMVVLGDDTWKALYSHQFDAYHVHESLNTRDIDVDSQIMQDISQYFENFTSNYSIFSNKNDGWNGSEQDWGVLVAHFLAIDHIGHTFSAFHTPVIANKMREYDSLLLMLVNHLPPDSLLLLFGDHGMTDDGEHGGSSKEELMSGLFIYTNSHGRELDGGDRHIHQHNIVNPPEVYQIDLVPTLSLLLDIPIPFSNVGKVITNPFFSRYFNRPILEILQESSGQLIRYIESYFLIEEVTESIVLKHIYKCFQHSNQTRRALAECLIELNCSESIADARFVEYRRMLCEASRQYGLCHLGEEKIVDDNTYMPCQRAIQQYKFLLQQVQDILRQKWVEFKSEKIIESLLVSSAIVCSLLAGHFHWTTILDELAGWKHIFNALTEEDDDKIDLGLCIQVLVNTLLLFVVLFTLASSSSNSFVIGEPWIAYTGLQCSILGRCSFLVFCTKRISHSKSIPCIISYILLSILIRLIQFQNLSNFVHIIFILAQLVTICWILHSLSIQLCVVADYKLIKPSKQITKFVVSYYLQHLRVALSIITIIAILAVGSSYFPFWNQNQRIVALSKLYSQQSCFFLIILFSVAYVVGCSMEWIGASFFRYEPKFYKCAHVNRLCAIQLALISLLFANSLESIMTLIVMMLVMFSWLKLNEIITVNDIHTFPNVCFLFFLGKMTFYATGHQMQFNSLQLMAGFVGTEKFNFFYSGLGLFVNTMSSEFLILIFLLIEGRSVRSLKSLKELAILRCGLILINMVTTFILRRHLMMWAIFAPKMLFESIQFMTFSLLYLLFA